MSFSSAVKKELSSRMFESEGSMRAELAGVIAASAVVTVDDKGGTTISLRTDNPAVAGHIYKLIKGLYPFSATVSIKKTKKFREHRAYTIALNNPEYAGHVLKDTRILRQNTQGQRFFAAEIPGIFLSKQDYIKSFIRGMFIGSGSLSNPEKAWHLEIVGRQKSWLENIVDMLAHYDIRAHLIERKKVWVLYIKESESLTSFLNLIGAHKALLTIENIRIMKEVRSDVNRKVNCETANITKTTTAAAAQIESIRYLAREKGLENLPSNLRAVAELRLEYPDISIKELGEKMSPPIGKSGVYHRLKKLMTIADEMQGKI